VGRSTRRLHFSENVWWNVVNIFTYFLGLVFPIFAFASFDDYYAQSFSDHFREKKFNESLQLLDRWEISAPSHKDRILGMRAAVYLAMGDLENSRMFMDECIRNLGVEGASDPLLCSILQMYYKVLENPTGDLSAPNGSVRSCKHEQPKGVKLKYWFGVGQILVGVLALPFSAGTSAALILSGTATLVDAAADALNNEEAWENKLNERQRINPDIQENSFLRRSKNVVPIPQPI
jgi:hypothetical protein